MTLQASSTAGGSDLLTIGAVPDHIVQFYDDEHFLCRAIGGFLARGMTSGQPLVVIATRPRLNAFQDDLRARGLDVVRGRESGLLTLLDARETLATFMNGAMPDAQLFESNVGGAIRTSLLANPPQCVRAYGEMVDLLWKDGNPEAALRLEDLWNDLGRQYSLCLVCAYSMDNFYRESHGRNFRICDRHSHVLPTEQYLDQDNAGRLREIARLQQRAAALEAELEHRKTLEKALREALAARRASEEALRHSQQELTALLTREQAVHIEAERANRLKDEFLAVLSHELRTPLNAILGWTQIASLRPFRSVAIRRALSVIERNAQLQLQLIDGLLDISRIQNGKMTLRCERVDLAVVVSAALDSVRPAAAAKSLRLDLSGEDVDCIVMGDAARLQQIVWNVVANAVKFTAKHGLVEVRLRRVGSDAEIEVRDDGEGIRPDFLPHVFERFRQADSSSARRHGGLGLGLALARSLAEAHGGRVSAVSQGTGFGSTFTIKLPVCPVRAASTIEAPISEPPGMAATEDVARDEPLDVNNVASTTKRSLKRERQSDSRTRLFRALEIPRKGTHLAASTTEVRKMPEDAERDEARARKALRHAAKRGGAAMRNDARPIGERLREIEEQVRNERGQGAPPERGSDRSDDERFVTDRDTGDEEKQRRSTRGDR